jgi:hypothetical protein
MFFTLVLMDATRMALTLIIVTGLFKLTLWALRFWISGIKGLFKK